MKNKFINVFTPIIYNFSYMAIFYKVICENMNYKNAFKNVQRINITRNLCNHYFIDECAD